MPVNLNDACDDNQYADLIKPDNSTQRIELPDPQYDEKNSRIWTKGKSIMNKNEKETKKESHADHETKKDETKKDDTQKRVALPHPSIIPLTEDKPKKQRT
jgi:hypothetical protein